MVNWTKKKLQCTRFIIQLFVVKGLKVVAKCCLNCEFFNFFFHNDLYCCLKDSNVEYQAKIFKLINEGDAQKQMIESSFGCRFRDLNYFDVVNFHIL